jgi:hypothetical protein
LKDLARSAAVNVMVYPLPSAFSLSVARCARTMITSLPNVPIHRSAFVPVALIICCFLQIRTKQIYASTEVIEAMLLSSPSKQAEARLHIEDLLPR